mmetsp:Transcript_14155/g.23556  ORF Transcript_14155/g.23556 Transcript_14155/m.23556 type:complete len:242 (-) Transcript_14155:76-801(-)
MPSMHSCPLRTLANSLAVNSMSSVVISFPATFSTRFFDAATAAGAANFIIPSSLSAAFFISSGVSTSSLTSPIFTPSSARMDSPVINIRRAFAAPIFATTYGEMVAGMTPSFTSDKAKKADLRAITWSQQETSPTPPPIADPLMRPHNITGSLLSSERNLAKFTASFKLSSSVILPAAWKPFGSPPAQNIAPFPVRNTMRIVGVSRTRLTAIMKPLVRLASIAFFAVGRLRVIEATYLFAL